MRRNQEEEKSISQSNMSEEKDDDIDQSNDGEGSDDDDDLSAAIKAKDLIVSIIYILFIFSFAQKVISELGF